MSRPGTVRAKVRRVQADPASSETVWDLLAAEEPLEIRLGFGPSHRRSTRSIAVTMRTPGHDHELAVGFLISEQIVSSADQIEHVGPEDPEVAGSSADQIIRVDLKPNVEVDLDRLQRHVFANSSCGVCGKATLQALNLYGYRPISGTGPVLDASTIHRLPDALRQRQSVFEATGGLHGSALVTVDGDLIAVREDIGRHNAVDKLIGAKALGTLDGPAANGGAEPAALVVSGRLGFEIVQKALAPPIPIVVAVGAPSSLAIEVADAFGLTVLGFVGPRRFNIYSSPQRVRAEVPVLSGRL